MTGSLETADKESAAFQVAPRVSLQDIEHAIVERYDMNGHTAALQLGDVSAPALMVDEHPLRVLSICLLVMRNGFTVIGKSAPASPANFNKEYGQKLAYEDAVRQLWPLMGYVLREKLL